MVKEGPVSVVVARIRLDLPGVDGLKQKRKVIRPLVSRIRQRFGIAAAEVGHHDVWKSSLLAVAALGNDAQELEGLVSDVVRFVTRSTDGVVVGWSTEVVKLGGDVGEVPFPGRDETAADAGSIEAAWLAEEES